MKNFKLPPLDAAGFGASSPYRENHRAKPLALIKDWPNVEADCFLFSSFLCLAPYPCTSSSPHGFTTLNTQITRNPGC